VDAFGCFGTLRWFPNGGEQRAVVFEYRYRGKVVNRKYRSSDKQMIQEKEPLPTLFNVDAIEPKEGDPDPERVIWVEGEPDVMALHEAGYPEAVTLKDGAPDKLRDENDPRRAVDKRFAALETHSDLLVRVKRFVLAGDMDGPGKVLREELARRLGRHRCWLVTWPEGCKDAGDTLRLHGPNAVQDAIEAATAYPIEGMQKLSKGALLALRHMPPPPVLTTGTGASDRILKLPAEGRIILVTGVPNHGKSSWVMFAKVHLMARHDRRFLAFSPEMQPWEGYIAQCASILKGRPFWPLKDGEGRPVPGSGLSDDEIVDAEEWLRDRLVMLVSDAEQQPPTLDWILERAQVGVLRDGTTDLVIDPWNQVYHMPGNNTETIYIGQCLQRLRSFSQRHGCNVWIVAHPTKLKPEKEGGKVGCPTMYDISGGANWANAADLGLAIHSPDGVTELHVLKSRLQRWGSRGTKALLNFDKINGRYSTPAG
jgi:twinkle protein